MLGTVRSSSASTRGTAEIRRRLRPRRRVDFRVNGERRATQARTIGAPFGNPTGIGGPRWPPSGEERKVRTVPARRRERQAGGSAACPLTTQAIQGISALGWTRRANVALFPGRG